MCLNPLKGWRVGINPSGKSAYHITSRHADFIYQVGATWHEGYTDGAKIPYGSTIVRDSITIPCGQCIECRLAYSRDWATRMMLEAQYHESSYFLTLTYDDEHVPISYYPDPDGEAVPALTLRKADLAPFIKRLRARLDYLGRPQIRFYACGEYGDTTHRPHYHLIVFGLQLTDLTQVSRSWRGDKYYSSQLISECWPYGYNLVAPVCFETCAYVARYVTKKWTGDYKYFYSAFNIEPEFSQMSRRPGIAWQYFADHKDDIYRMDELFLSLTSGGRCLRPPKYYDRLYDLDDPDAMAAIKEQRRYKADAAQLLRSVQSNLSAEEVLEAQANLYEKRIHMLKREEI